MTKKVIDMVRRYREVYNLSEGDFAHQIRHDAVHAMTGLGINVADELRVAIIETALNASYAEQVRLSDAVDRHQRLHRQLVDAMKGEWNFNADQNRLETRKFRKVQATSTQLDEREVRRLFDLGRRMFDTIRRVTGTSYILLSHDTLANIPFDKVNFTAEIYAVKKEFEMPKNKKIDGKCTKIFRHAARKQGRIKDIPAAGQPWNGMVKKSRRF